MLTKDIDFSKEYKILGIPDKQNRELAERGLGTYPGITHITGATYNTILSRYVNTGLDEFAPHVLNLEAKEREAEQKAIREKREQLENLIGLPNFLSPTSDNWASILTSVFIRVEQDLKISVNDHTNVLKPKENYKDAITLLILMSDPDFPKSKEDIAKPRFKNSKFYITTEDELTGASKVSSQKRRKANVYMAELFEGDGKFDRAWNIAYFLGLVKKQKVTLEQLDETLEKVVIGDRTGDTVDRFIEACEMDNKTLLLFNMFKKAIAFRIIGVDSKDGTYYRGSVNYRKTIDESVDYLKSAGMEVELAELRGAVVKKEKTQNSLA